MYFQNLITFDSYVGGLALQDGEQAMIFVGDRSAADLPAMRACFEQGGIPYFGGVFPGLLHDGCLYREGFLVQIVRPVFRLVVLPYLMRVPSELGSMAGRTAILLIDGLSSRFRELINTVEKKLGHEIAYVGGGAGHYDLEHRPCLFDAKGVYEDAVIVCVLEGRAELAVRHGWEIMDGPYEISRSERNILSELDGCRAMDVYRDVIEEHAHVTLSQVDFFSFAKEHPFGILQEDGSIIVRDPISVNDAGEIICVADIPAKSQAYVLKGDKRSLLASSNEIAKECVAKAPGAQLPMLFDCISRAMFLENDFSCELRNIQSKLSAPLIGTLSIGEIASRSDGAIDIHNKSTILGLFA